MEQVETHARWARYFEETATSWRTPGCPSSEDQSLESDATAADSQASLHLALSAHSEPWLLPQGFSAAKDSWRTAVKMTNLKSELSEF